MGESPLREIAFLEREDLRLRPARVARAVDVEYYAG
jgi:hypothetical protein